VKQEFVHAFQVQGLRTGFLSVQSFHFKAVYIDRDERRPRISARS
jgi:hypothetical protein